MVADDLGAGLGAGPNASLPDDLDVVLDAAFEDALDAFLEDVLEDVLDVFFNVFLGAAADAREATGGGPPKFRADWRSGISTTSNSSESIVSIQALDARSPGVQKTSGTQ